jgi:hypothetical protein
MTCGRSPKAWSCDVSGVAITVSDGSTKIEIKLPNTFENAQIATRAAATATEVGSVKRIREWTEDLKVIFANVGAIVASLAVGAATVVTAASYAIERLH